MYTAEKSINIRSTNVASMVKTVASTIDLTERNLAIVSQLEKPTTIKVVVKVTLEELRKTKANGADAWPKINFVIPVGTKLAGFTTKKEHILELSHYGQAEYEKGTKKIVGVHDVKKDWLSDDELDRTAVQSVKVITETKKAETVKTETSTNGDEFAKWVLEKTNHNYKIYLQVMEIAKGIGNDNVRKDIDNIIDSLK